MEFSAITNSISPVSSIDTLVFPFMGAFVKTPEGVVYQLLAYLGRGSFGQAFEVVDVTSGRRFAMKILETATERQRNDNIRELNNNAYLRKCGAYAAPIMQYFDVFQAGDKLCVVFEKLDTTLWNVFQKEQGPMRMDALKTIAYQILLGVAKLHEIGMVHCDLKLDNVMYVNRNHLQRLFDVKLIDFGLLLPFQRFPSLQGSVFMAKGYRAPEIYLGLPLTEKVDIWSVGVMLYELFTGEPMLRVHTDADGITQISQIFGLPVGVEQNGHFYDKYFTFNPSTGSHVAVAPISYSFNEFATPSIIHNLAKFGLSARVLGSPLPVDHSFCDLLARLLTVDVRHRFSACEALQHPFFNQVHTC